MVTHFCSTEIKATDRRQDFFQTGSMSMKFLPMDITMAETKSQFKSLLKTHFSGSTLINGPFTCRLSCLNIMWTWTFLSISAKDFELLKKF